MELTHAPTGICPSCGKTLTSARSAHGPLLVCAACAGRLLSLEAVSRARVPANLLRLLAPGKRKTKRVSGRHCPHCRARMNEVSVPTGGIFLPLDVCDRCAVVWFDRGELQRLLRTRPALKRKPRPAADARQEAASDDVPQPSQYTTFPLEPQDGIADWILGILGLPIELNQPLLQKLPWITWTLSLLCVAVTMACMKELEGACNEWGFMPSNPFRHGGATLVTSFFLHGGLYHVFTNVYFLIVFGDNSEERFGRVRYALLLIAAHGAGLLCHGIMDPRPELSLVGASGAISGVIVFYAIVFPWAKLGFLFGLGRLYRVIEYRFVSLRAFWWVIIWLALQVYGAFQQAYGMTPVSHFGHLGGAMMGAAAGLWAFLSDRRRRDRRRRNREREIEENIGSRIKRL